MKFGIVRFPGSNCDNDALYATSNAINAQSEFIWHKENNVPSDIDCVILPGGFSYGDYLRSGAIARFSPIMKDVVRFANEGGLVIGICNGFQVLTEAGLLPGTLSRNAGQLFRCKSVHLKTVSNETPFTNTIELNSVLTIPIAHGDGCYFAAPETIRKLEENNQIIFQYCDAHGNVTVKSNPNGSISNIAGICNEKRNVLGMMPHPERVCDPLTGGTDGVKIFESIMNNFVLN